MRDRQAFVVTSALAALILGSCLQSASAPASSPAVASASAIPSASATATVAATPVAGKGSPRPMPTERPSDLVVRHEVAGDTCCPVPLAVLTADGRFVTRTDDNQLRERRLTPAGVQRVREEIAGTGLFERDQWFPLEVRPDASPPARGVGSFLFKAWRGTRAVEVQTATDQGADERYFQPSAARTRLDRLSKQLVKPETWLPAEVWADSTPRAYEPVAYALVLHTEIEQSNEAAKIDELVAAWPFAVGPLQLGETLPATAGPQADTTRCAVVASDDMLAVRNAIVRAAGPAAIYMSTDGAVLASFASADSQARLVLTMRPLLPDRTSCTGVYVQ